MYSFNLGAHYDGNTHTYTIPGSQIDHTKTVVEALVPAIKNCIEVVNNGAHDIKILHKESGLSLIVAKSNATPIEQEKALITEALEQLNKPGIDKAQTEYRKKLARDINDTIRLSEQGATIQGRTGKTCYRRDTKVVNGNARY